MGWVRRYWLSWHSRPEGSVLLDANPLDDIRNVRKIRAVVLDGKLLYGSRLDSLMRR